MTAHAIGMKRVLIAGDSIALGTGADASRYAVGSQLKRDYALSQVDVVAKSGARVRDVITQLAQADKGYDIALIIVGGNDVLRFTRLAKLALHLRCALMVAARKARWVIVANSANVGGAPRFGWPLTAVLSRRSLNVKNIYEQVSACLGVRFVNFTFAPEHDVFARDPQRYFAADRIHPSAAAYETCYQWLLDRGGLKEQLRKVSRASALHGAHHSARDHAQSGEGVSASNAPVPVTG